MYNPTEADELWSLIDGDDEESRQLLREAEGGDALALFILDERDRKHALREAEELSKTFKNEQEATHSWDRPDTLSTSIASVYKKKTTTPNIPTHRTERDTYITVTRLAELRQVNRSTIIAAIDKGFLPATRINPGGMWRVNIKDIPAYLRRVKMSQEDIDIFMKSLE